LVGFEFLTVYYLWVLAKLRTLIQICMQESDVELETKVKKYLRGEGANLEVYICLYSF